MEIKQIEKLIEEIKKGYLMPCKPRGVEGCAICEAKLVIEFLERHIKFIEDKD